MPLVPLGVSDCKFLLCDRFPLSSETDSDLSDCDGCHGTFLRKRNMHRRNGETVAEYIESKLGDQSQQKMNIVEIGNMEKALGFIDENVDQPIAIDRDFILNRFRVSMITPLDFCKIAAVFEALTCWLRRY